MIIHTNDTTTNEVFEIPDSLYRLMMSEVEKSSGGRLKHPVDVIPAINAVLCVLWRDGIPPELRRDGNIVYSPQGKIIARNDRLDEIMVIEPNGNAERYKKVIE